MAMRRASLMAQADRPGERALLEAWLTRWQAQLLSCSDNLGCGCCVDQFDVEAPEQALRELPPQVFIDSAHASAPPPDFFLQDSQKTTDMGRIDATFQRLRSASRKALIPFVTAGDPGLDSTVPVMHALVAAGADVIELGVPFSDPMADGPTIQRSSERALARGGGLRHVLQVVSKFRTQDPQTPVVLMGYLNPVEIHGTERFAQEAVGAGVDGVLLVDLPPEEAAETREVFTRHGLDLIALASPTTTAERQGMLCDTAQGYLYYVSFAGVTGASDRLDTKAAGLKLKAIRERSTVPVVAGFGIKDAASAKAMAVDADGVVVGSALVAALEAAGEGKAVETAGQFLSPLRQALDSDG